MHAIRAMTSRLRRRPAAVSLVLVVCAALLYAPHPAGAEVGGATGVAGALDAHAAAPKADPRQIIAKRLEVHVEDVRPSPVPGLYEVISGSDILYASADGRYVLQGDLYDVARGEDVTEQRLTTLRSGAIAELKAVGDDQAITFGPKDARYTVTVFTDVDCAYCRKLHSHIAEYNKLGIRVRYLFFPRSGPNTPSWSKAEAVWCAPNRQEALTRAKLGESVPGSGKCSSPVAKTYHLAQELMLRGTPGIFTDKSEYISGYLGPEELLQRLKQHDQGDGKAAADKAAADKVKGAAN